MKKVLFLLLFLTIVGTASVGAQITIGKNDLPGKGVYLDLSPQGVTHGGLLLPNVLITNADSIPLDLIGSFTPAERDNSPDLKGMVVYNTNASMKGGNGEGIYVWDGGKWNMNGSDGVFTSACTPASSVAAAGGSVSCSVSAPGCTAGGVYTFHFIAGSEYAQLDVTDAGAGTFTLTLAANDRAAERTVILTVTSPCGKSQTFFYPQDGDDSGCDISATAPKIVAENGLTSLCSGGAVYLYLQGAPAGNYIWTLNGEEVGRGTGFIATRTGKYIVYANKIGCTAYKPDTLTVTAGSTGAPGRVSIIVGENNGLVCSAGETVKLFTIGAISGTVSWYRDGRRTGLTGTSIDAGTGTWFAVVEDGPCASKPSDEITVQLDRNAGNAGISDFVFTINGAAPSGTTDLCSGGTVNLAVTSPQSGVDYTWYNNNTVIGQGISTTYSIAGLTGSFVLRCRATGLGACPVEKLTEATIAAGAAPARPAILVSNPGNALCGGTAILTADVTGTVSSCIWYYSADNSSYSQLPTTAQTLTINRNGYYRVAAADGNCLSELSVEKNIALSSALTNVSISGPATVNPNDFRTYTARMDNPQGAQYAWSIGAPNTSGAAIQGSATGNSIVVNFAAAGSATIVLNAANACGDAIPRPVTFPVTVACTDAAVSPASTAGDQPVTVMGTETLSLSVTGAGSPALSYQWYKNTAAISGETSAAYVKNNVTAADAGDYYCEVTSSCNGTQATSATFVVSVQTHPKDMALGEGSFSGRTCFDIAATANGTGCGDLTSRTYKADFASLTDADKTYTFTATTANVSNVRFVVDDAEGCVASTSDVNPNGTAALGNGSSVTLTVEYKTTLNSSSSSPLIVGRSRSQAAVVNIYVVYWDGSEDVSIPVKVTIQDCACCGAWVAPNTWKVFMCHNLGADQSVDPFTPTFATNGAYYQWGRKDPAASAPASDGSDATNITWSTSLSGYFGDNSTGADVKVKSQYDPCPAGFRVPSYDEWDYLIQNNARTNKGTFEAGDANWSGVMFGPALMLPAPGYRETNDGSLSRRGLGGYYWSTRYSYLNSAYYMYAGSNAGKDLTIIQNDGFYLFGFSVRCIAE